MIRPVESPRYHALDRLRATAMLLGVVYHTLMFRMFFMGSPLGPMGPARGGGDRYLQDWLHSFRMISLVGPDGDRDAVCLGRGTATL